MCWDETSEKKFQSPFVDLFHCVLQDVRKILDNITYHAFDFSSDRYVILSALGNVSSSEDHWYLDLQTGTSAAASFTESEVKCDQISSGTML